MRPNPDPLRPEDDRIWIGGEWLDRRAYEVGRFDGHTARPIWRLILAALALAFVAGLLIGRLLVPVTVSAASASRPAQPAIPAVRIGTGSEPDPAGQIGAPERTEPSTQAWPAMVASAGAPPLTEPPAVMGGLATWYDDGPGLYGAVPSWRWGDRPYRVRVTAGANSVYVTIRDFCGCPGARIIDLSTAAFRRLTIDDEHPRGDLGRGVIPVLVTVPNRPGITPPPTDVHG